MAQCTLELPAQYIREDYRGGVLYQVGEGDEYKGLPEPQAGEKGILRCAAQMAKNKTGQTQRG